MDKETGWVYNAQPHQDKRSNNQGFFWILSQRQGCNVKVINWTFSGHGLHKLIDQYLAEKPYLQ